MYRFILMLALAAAALPMQAAAQGTAERLYVMECGQGAVPDLSRWSPGVNVGVKTEYVTNCYLVRHAKGWLLWETGAGDDLVNIPEGRGNFTRWRLKRTLASQLAEIGVNPDDVNFIAASHTHFDHIGNVNMFPKSVLLAQKAEYHWPLPKGGPRFNPAHPSPRSRAITTCSETAQRCCWRRPATRLGTSRSCCGSRTPARFCSPATPRTSARTGNSGACRPSIPTGINRSPRWSGSPQFSASTKAQLWIHHDKPQSDARRSRRRFTIEFARESALNLFRQRRY